MSNFSLGDRGPFGRFPLDKRSVASRSSFASVVYWHYKRQNLGAATGLASASDSAKLDTDAFTFETGQLEEEIASVRMNKSLDQSSGTFDLTLFPTTNWKAKLSPGDWIAIYIFDEYEVKKGAQRGNTNLLMLGNIDRVSRTLSKNDDDDKIELRYTVSGRDFGKVFEDTDIWFDPYTNQMSGLDVALRTAGLPLSGNPSDITKAAIDVFLGPGAITNLGKTAGLGMWRVPKPVVTLFGSQTGASANFYDLLRVNITPNLPGFKANQMLAPDDSNSLWELLKRGANSLVNDLYIEMVKDSNRRSVPTITLRPRPVCSPALRSSVKGTLGGAVQTLQELSSTSFLELSPAEIRFENMGKDDHSRFNLFWLYTTLKTDYMLSPSANLDLARGIGNPTFQRQSIQRHGLRRLQQTLEFCYQEDARKKGVKVLGANSNLNIFRAFMEQVYDMHSFNHLYDAGTIECTGVVEAEVGKALIIKPSRSGDPEKIFLIEGYEHEWTFPNVWRTTFTLTHGQFKSTVSKNIFIDLSEADGGQPDSLIDNVYIAKTVTDK